MTMHDRRILVVDDFKEFRGLVRSLIEKMGACVIDEASEGLEAVQKAKDLQPDLVVLDIGLPNLNGLEASRQIFLVAPGTKILFLSQESSPDVVRAAMCSGAFGYVQKARTERDLQPAIEAALKGRFFVSSSLKLAACKECEELLSNYQPNHVEID